MSIGYTWEKFYGAVLTLARSEGTLPQRLAKAYEHIAMLTSDDFSDDELWDAYTSLVHALRAGTPGEVEGRGSTSLLVLRLDHAAKIVETLLHLYTELTRLEERHYRDLPMR
jgi:hypothetical protein